MPIFYDRDITTYLSKIYIFTVFTQTSLVWSPRRGFSWYLYSL